MIATIVNCLSIIIGSIIGLLLAGRISEKYKGVVFEGAGITTIVIGVSMALASQKVIFLAMALIAGGLLGTAMNIDGGILRFGQFLERLLPGKGRKPGRKPGRKHSTVFPEEGSKKAKTPSSWDFGHGFLNASVLFCVGAMALVGSFKAGTEGDYTLILTKSVLDGFMAIIFSAAMGPGVAFSALSVLFYQGLLTLGAVGIRPFVSELMVSELTGVGGAMVLMIGFNLLSLKKIKTADFLPALVLMVVFVLMYPYIQGLGALLGL